eukprot:gene15778-biopygen23224
MARGCRPHLAWVARARRGHGAGVARAVQPHLAWVARAWHGLVLFSQGRNGTARVRSASAAVCFPCFFCRTAVRRALDFAALPQ